MKFTKKSILAILLVCVCMMGCFAHSYVNADDNIQPLATPALEEPEKTESTANIEQEIIPVQDDNDEDVIKPEYVTLYTSNGMNEYVAKNSDGQYLVKLQFNFANSEKYGTDEIHKILNDLLGDIKDEQYVDGEMFTAFTNTVRGDKVLFTDRCPIGCSVDIFSPYIDYKCTLIAIENGDIPNLEEIYVKQDMEVLYLSKEQYDKVLESDICNNTIRYADYIGESLKCGYRRKWDYAIFGGLAYPDVCDHYFYEQYIELKENGAFERWCETYLAPYIVE